MNAAERFEVTPMKATNNQETRIALLEQSQGHIYEALVRIEKRFDYVDQRLDKSDQKFNDRFDKIEERFDKVDQKIDALDKKFDAKHDALNAKIDATTKWLIGLAVSVLFSAATLGFSMYSFFHKLS